MAEDPKDKMSKIICPICKNEIDGDYCLHSREDLAMFAAELSDNVEEPKDKMIVELSKGQVELIKSKLEQLDPKNVHNVYIELSERDREFLQQCIMLNEKFEGGTYSLECLAMQAKLELLDLKMSQLNANLKASLQELYNIIHNDIMQGMS